MPEPARMGNYKGYLFWQSFLFVFILLLAVYVFFRSPFFIVDQITVQGQSLLNQQDIVKASGIVTDINIFKVDLPQATANVSALPMVQDVYIERRYPSTVVINVLERVPVALVAYQDGFIELDEAGYYLRLGSVAMAGLPVLTGVEVQSVNPGSKVQADNLIQALQVVQQLPDELRLTLSELHMGDDGGVVLYTMEGVACHLGLPEQVQQKGDYFLQVKRELMEQGKNIDYVDFSIINSPVVKYRQ